MNDGHKGMTCEREKLREGEEEVIFCVTLWLAVSSKAPSFKITLLSGTSVTEKGVQTVFSWNFFYCLKAAFQTVAYCFNSQRASQGGHRQNIRKKP